MVVIPITGWNTITEKALRFALRLSPGIMALYVSGNEEEEIQLRSEWKRNVEQPLGRASLPAPRLEIVLSPYRHLINPVQQQIRLLEREFPFRQVAVIIPELVGAWWWQYLLHNQRASLLKAALLFWGDQRVVVINVPWYLREEPAMSEQPAASRAA